MRRNPGVFMYNIGTENEYNRHELLRIPRVTDTTVPQGYVDHRQHVTVPSDEEWDRFSDHPSEDSY